MKHHSAKLHLFGAILALAGVACHTEDRLDLRGLIINGDTLALSIPGEFRLNRPDRVTVTTFGDACTSFARTEVDVHGLLATVEPFDFWEATGFFVSDGQGVCNSNGGVSVNHAAELTFDQLGEATIWFIGLERWDDSTGRGDSVVSVSRRVQVR